MLIHVVMVSPNSRRRCHDGDNWVILFVSRKFSEDFRRRSGIFQKYFG